MRRLVGYDLNGWRDFAARNWLEQLDDDSAANDDVEQVVSGGIGGVVVRLEQDGIVGGAQALRAPHGLGPGWGVIGADDRRYRVSDLLAEPDAHVPELSAALRGMADPAGAGWRGPTTAVVAIQDTAAYELEQEALLRTLRTIRATTDSLLVWRPVLACLSALSSGMIGGATRVGIVGHVGQGLTSQRLLIREHRGIKTPERRETGVLHVWQRGLDALRGAALQALMEASARTDRPDHLATARILVPLALGEPPRPEAIREPSGGWEIVAPAPIDLSLPSFPPAFVERLEACQIILVDTPTAGRTRTALIDALAAAFPGPVRPVAHDDIARGGLLAAGRIVRGEPVYFDFLPQLSTIVQDAEGARSFDLIPSDAVPPAGRIYRSKEPARLGLSADTTTIKVYLRKQQADACRLAEVSLAAPAGRTASVTLDVEQAPAAGRARLTLASEVFAAPLQVDWDRAQVLSESWEAVIDSLQRPKPAIPNRVALPCGIAAWRGQFNRRGLETLLLDMAGRDAYDWDVLARLLSARPDGLYAISSDGELPEGVSEQAVAALDAATEAAKDHVLERIRGSVRDNNDSLRFLTWQFHRCPETVVEEIVRALEGPTGSHVFSTVQGHHLLLAQGAGRTASRTDHEARALSSMMTSTWRSQHLACAGFLLSRSDTAPALLSSDQVREIARVLVQRNEEAVGQPYTARYLYVPIVLLGLIRYRLRDPWALVAGQDPIADDLVTSTQAVIADMASRFPEDMRIGRYRDILTEVCDWLRGEGRNPDILLDLTNMATP